MGRSDHISGMKNPPGWMRKSERKKTGKSNTDRPEQKTPPPPCG